VSTAVGVPPSGKYPGYWFKYILSRIQHKSRCMNETGLRMCYRELNPKPEILEEPETEQSTLRELLLLILFSGGAVVIALVVILYCPDYRIGVAMFAVGGFLLGLLERQALLMSLVFLMFFSYLFAPFIILGYIWDYFWFRYPAKHAMQNWIGIIVFLGIIASCWGMIIVGDYLMRKKNNAPQPAKLDYFDEYSSPTYIPGLFSGRWG
jgi:hypothetical protein